MKRYIFYAALACLLFLVDCSNGLGYDPAETEATFSLMLPALISKDDGEITPSVESQESPDAAKTDAAESLSEDTQNATETLESHAAEYSSGIPLQESKVATETFAVSSWHVAMVSATGFDLQEVVAPAEEPITFTVQAGKWKITLLAQDSIGNTIATSEVKGLSISAGDNRAVSFSLEWPSPENPNPEESLES